MAKKTKADAGRGTAGANAALALKVRENRIRRAAKRQNLELEKARQRDPRGALYGTYALSDGRTWIYASESEEGFGLTLDEVEAFLNTPASRRRAEGANGVDHAV